jgi:hypothetical protein
VDSPGPVVSSVVLGEVDEDPPGDSESDAVGAVPPSEGEGAVDDGDPEGVGGVEDGAEDGVSEGVWEGESVGASVGSSVGESVGVGSLDGSAGSTSSRRGIEMLPSASGRSTNRHR